MPKPLGMAQLSRPYQIALAAVVLFALMWFAVLHRPGSTASTPARTPSAPATHAVRPTTRTVAHATPRTSRVATRPSRTVTHVTTSVHRSATRAITHAAAPSRHVVAPHAATRTRTVTHAVRHTTAPAVPARPHTTASRTAQTTTSPQRGSAPAAQSQVSSTARFENKLAAQLSHGRIVLVLFWNPRASDDAEVHAQVADVVRRQGGRVVAYEAEPAQIQEFGSITREIQVYQTPTLLIVNARHQVSTLTGYTEAFAIEQAIGEARGRPGENEK